MAESETVVLVTGASGFIASQVVKTVQEAGYKVRATVRDLNNENKVKHLHEICPNATQKIEVVQADLHDADSWNEAVSGCDFIMHVASPFPLAEPKKEDDVIKPAVEGTLNILRAAAKTGTVKRVVLTSSAVAISLEGNNTKPYTEEDWTDLQNPIANAYHKSKVLAEKAAWDFVKDLPEGEKFELSVVNPVFVVGPTLHGISGSSMYLIEQLMERKMPALPQFVFPCVDVRDVARAHLECMKRPEAVGNRHILFTKNMTLKEMATVLDKEFRPQGYNVPLRTLPGFLLTMVSWFDASLRGSKGFVSKPFLYDNSRFKNVLEISPTPPEQSLVDMAYSMVDKGFIKRTAKYRGNQEQQTV